LRPSRSKMEMTLNNDRKKAIVATIVFHALVLLLFLFFGLTQPDPLPEQEGAMIELGWTDSGSGETESEVVEEVQQVEEVTQTEQVQEVSEAVEEEVITQEESSVSTPTEPVVETPVVEEPVIEDPKPSDALTNAMGSVFNNNTTDGGSDGDSEDTPGNQGNPDGAPDGHGVMGGSGNSWNLSGRGYEGGAVVTEKPREEGRVVLKIWVGRDGKVSRTSLDLRNSNTTSQHLVSLAKKAAMKAKFNSDPSSAVEQQGSMTFVFKLE